MRALLLAALLLVSASTAGVAAVGATPSNGTDGTESLNSIAMQHSVAMQSTPQVENNSSKVMTLSWFRDSGNGPYPVPPAEDGGNESPGIDLFTKAEGDSQLRVDNSTARNPNGQYDMVVLHVETTGLEELNPPTNGTNKGLVTQSFLNNENWNVDVSQANGDKTLDIAANQEGYENPNVPRTADVPPVMVFADTEGIDEDYLHGDGGTESGVFVWIDPNRAKLTENGDTASFKPGEEYEVTWNVHGQTATSTFEIVDGSVSLNESYSPANRFGAELTGQSTLAGGTPVELVLETEDGTVREATTDVSGNLELGGDTKGTVPAGTLTGSFDLSGLENQSFTLTAYAPGPDGGHADGKPVRDDDEYLSEENRIKVAESSGTIRDIIDPNYRIPEANVTGGKVLSVPYGIGEEGMDASDVGGLVGDGETGLDSSVAYDSQGTQSWDGMFLHYEVSQSALKAIDRSPGKNVISKFQSSPLSLDVVQTNADGEPKRLNLSRNTTGVQLIMDREKVDDRIYNNGSKGLFLWIDPNEATFFQDGEPVQMKPGETYEATLTAETDSGTISDTVEFDAIDGTTSVTPMENGKVAIPQAENAEIQLQTQLAAGSEWSLSVEAVDANFSVEEGLEPTGTGSVLAGKIAGSMPNATSTVTFDTSDLEIGTEFRIQVALSEDPPDSPVTVLNTTGVVVAPPSASISLSSQSGAGDTVTVDSVELSDGGFLSVHTGSPTGVTVGSSSYLESGSHSDVSVELREALSEDTEVYVVVHRDSNGNQEYNFPVADDPYKKSGSVVSASASYTVESQQTTEMPMDETTTSSAATTTGDESASGVPGFGLGVTLVALVAAMLLAYRRD